MLADIVDDAILDAPPYEIKLGYSRLDVLLTIGNLKLNLVRSTEWIKELLAVSIERRLV
jgi:hypothetical protein